MSRYHSIVAPVYPSIESCGLDVALNTRLTYSCFANLDIPGCLSFISKGLKCKVQVVDANIIIQ